MSAETLSSWAAIATLDLEAASHKAFDEANEKLQLAAKEMREKGTLPDLKIETGVVLVTPQWAETALLRNAGNRQVTIGHVQRLVTLMKSGAWKLAQPLLFDEEGMLHDGQNRLLAVYFGGVEVPMTLMVVPKQEQLFAVVDNGKPRSASDALFVAGMNGQAPAISSAIQLLWKYEANALSSIKAPRGRKMEHLEVLAYAESHPGVGKVAHLLAGSFPKAISTIGNKGAAVAFAYLVKTIQGEASLIDFMKPLATGANLDEESVILALRNRLLGAGEDDEAISPSHRLALLIKAFNMVRNGTKVGKKGLYLRDNEKFPRVEASPSLSEAAE